MTHLSPALLTDLEYAAGRYGLTVAEVPRDQEGRTITDRLAMLVETGESYCGSEFRTTDLRAESGVVWQLFPENRKTVEEQIRLIDEVGDLLRDEEEFRTPPRLSLVRQSDLPRREHVDALRAVLGAIDGNGDVPVVDANMWADASLFEEAATIVPVLREAERAAAARAALIAELVSGRVPPVSAEYVRKALDSEVDGLRNADITVAGHRVAAARLRDAAHLALDALLPHYEVAERIRELRDDLDLIDDALHWPGHWRQAPRRATPQRLVA
ncbi:hypothetical protein [Microbacterium kunmingense]|uniref:hypothetical protein n=1 Tax=Microbacterium kunmingense TaxID=2915939 RepID=UPI003D70698B